MSLYVWQQRCFRSSWQFQAEVLRKDFILIMFSYVGFTILQSYLDLNSSVALD